MMLPSDLVLVQDNEFKKYVDIYADDKKKVTATNYVLHVPPVCKYK
jgi:hypothetical protein